MEDWPDGAYAAAKKLWMFDPEERIWLQKATAQYSHPEGIFSAFGDKLFLAGGLNEDGPSYQETAEVYDIKSDQWTNILNFHPNLDIPLLCSVAYCNTFVDERTGNIHFSGLNYIEDGEDFKFDILVFNPITGYLSQDQNWSRDDTLSQFAICTLPKGRFKC